MHQIEMLFKIAFLAKALSTLGAFERLNARVQANMVFNVARFVESLTTAVD